MASVTENPVTLFRGAQSLMDGGDGGIRISFHLTNADIMMGNLSLK